MDFCCLYRPLPSGPAGGGKWLQTTRYEKLGAFKARLESLLRDTESLDATGLNTSDHIETKSMYEIRCQSKGQN